MKNIAIFGAGGAIGGALMDELNQKHPESVIHTFSRTPILSDHPNIHGYSVDYLSEQSIMECADKIKEPLELVIIAIGILHDDDLKPEKSIRELSRDNFIKVYEINAIAPSLIAKHFIPRLNKKSPTIFTALSARVGSISDNRLGGWYAYRASKAALNMIIKNLAIETKRTLPHSSVVGLHPGTVESHLSSPFSHHVAKDHLFSPQRAAQQLCKVISSIKPDHSGQCIDWEGKMIDP